MHTYRIGKLDINQPRLLKELQRIAHFKFTEAYNNYLFGGPWKSCMLWSIGGETGDGRITNYDYTQPRAKTNYAEQLPYLTELISQYFNLKYLNFARLAIITNSVLIPHRDLLELGAVPAHARNAHRIHVPLITHDNCYFWEENIVYQMRFGEAWFLDASRAHSAASLSEQDRVHLMLDFPDVEDASQLIRFKKDDREEIPPESIQARSALTEAERRELLALGNVIDIDNFKDIFSIVIKKHYCKDGGDNFVWNTMRQIAASSRNPAVGSKVEEMYRYFMVERSD